MNDYTHYNDQELWTFVQQNEEGAFVEFFNRRAGGLLIIAERIIKHHEAARDLVQEVFVRAWLHRETLAKMEKPASWLLRTAQNLSIDYLRRQQLETSWLRKLKQSSSDINSTSDQQLLGAELSGLIHEAVNLLPAQRKKIYLLSREQGFDRKQIAAELNISEHTVKNQLGAAMQFIQVFLRNRGVQLFAIFAVFRN